MDSDQFPSIDEFEILATELIQTIPAKFLEGLGGIFVQPIEKKRDDVDQVYTLGEYIRQPHFEPQICLYYGSFKQVHYGKNRDAIKRAMWELITHELQHHLERNFEIQDLAQEDQERLARIKIAQGKGRPFELLRTQRLINPKTVGLNLIADITLPEKLFKTGTRIRLTATAADWHELIVNIPQHSLPGKVMRLSNMGYHDKSRAGDFYLFLQSDKQQVGKLKIEGDESLVVFANDKIAAYKKLLKQKRFDDPQLAWPALNEKKLNLDYYYDLVLPSELIAQADEIVVAGLGQEKFKLKLKLKPNEEDSSYTFKLRGLGEATGTTNGDVYLTIYSAK